MLTALLSTARARLLCGIRALFPAVYDEAIPPALLRVVQGDISLGIQLFERIPVFRGNGHADAYRNPAVTGVRHADGPDARTQLLSLALNDFPG